MTAGSSTSTQPRRTGDRGSLSTTDAKFHGKDCIPNGPQSYDELCAAVLARYGETYRPLPGTREFRVSPPPTRAVPPGPEPSHDHDLPSPATSLSTSRPASSAVVPAPHDPPDDVQNPTPEISAPDDVAAATDQSATSRVSSTPSADGPSGMSAIRPSSLSSTAIATSLTSASTLATLPHDLEVDTDDVSPAVRPSLAEDSPSTVSEHDLSPTSKLCASCQQRPASPSTSTAAEVRAPYQLRPHLQDAATMTEAPEDDMPDGSPMAEQATHVTPATSAGIQHPDLRSSPRVPPAEGASTRTGASSEPAATTPARCHRRFAPEPLTQGASHPTCGHCAGALSRPPPRRYFFCAADNVRGVRPPVTGIVACATPLLMTTRLSEIGSNMQSFLNDVLSLGKVTEQSCKSMVLGLLWGRSSDDIIIPTQAYSP
ncbi:hypothetical protein HPB52_011897 [Rhipicephalus sanguineus]|uniref:Uncharacterized protein n=1 Tax=Rhipicephalus sanguineus TaxID=34632 RepID=A0A9D4PM52_RHISA|nr:hypothetical protein HPB52_011897 [Rhipicephalus sanguineus]